MNLECLGQRADGDAACLLRSPDQTYTVLVVWRIPGVLLVSAFIFKDLMRRMRLDQEDSAGDATNFGTLHFSEFRRLLEDLRILREAREARTPRYLVVEFGTQLYFSMVITVTSLRVYGFGATLPLLLRALSSAGDSGAYSCPPEKIARGA